MCIASLDLPLTNCKGTPTPYLPSDVLNVLLFQIMLRTASMANKAWLVFRSLLGTSRRQVVVETTVVTCEGREVKDGSLKHVEEEGVAVGGKHGSPGTTWGEFPLYNITR